ncbi:MAG: hypothetical protein ACQES1_06795 [Bacteroidota bacterium]
MAEMDINKRLLLLRNLIMSPVSTWKELMKFPLKKRVVLSGFFFPGVIIFGLAEFFGMVLSAYFAGSILYILIYSLVIMIGLSVAYYVSLMALRYLLRSFDCTDTKHRSEQLLALTLVLGYLPIAVMALFRSMFFLGILSAYAIYLFWVGTQKIPGLHKEKLNIFGILAVIFVVAIHLLVLFLVLATRSPLMEWL